MLTVGQFRFDGQSWAVLRIRRMKIEHRKPPPEMIALMNLRQTNGKWVFRRDLNYVIHAGSLHFSMSNGYMRFSCHNFKVCLPSWPCHPSRHKSLNLGRIIHNDTLFAKSILWFDTGWLVCNFLFKTQPGRTITKKRSIS